MAELKEGQTAEYWWKRAEQYRKTLGGVNASSNRLKQKLIERDKEIAELRELLWIGYFHAPKDDAAMLDWKKAVGEKLKGEKR